MCGRARCALSRDEVASTSGVPQERWRDADKFQPDQNMSPGHWSPVVKYDKNGQLELQTMKWGLVPSFSKPDDKPDHFRMFNARSETVPEKGIFKRLLGRQRCVVVLDGFYEWNQEHKQKQPYYIYLTGGVTKMAGLFDCWQPAEGELTYTFTILTTDSSKRLQWLHDRMPVILPNKAAEEQWLQPAELGAKDMAAVCEPFNGEELRWHAVTPAMSNQRYHGEDCAKEFKKPSIKAFFKPKQASAANEGKQQPKSAATEERVESVKAEVKTGPSESAAGPSAETKPSPAGIKQEETSQATGSLDIHSSAHKRPSSHSEPAKNSPNKKQKGATPAKGQAQIKSFFTPNSK